MGYDVRKLRSEGRVFSAARVACGRLRNKIALKALKTNDPAKSGRFASNDFKDLQSGRRNLFFRLAKDLALFA
jgi:hypothetical protein